MKRFEICHTIGSFQLFDLAFLVITYHSTMPGGTNVTFNWGQANRAVGYENFLGEAIDSTPLLEGRIDNVVVK